MLPSRARTAASFVALLASLALVDEASAANGNMPRTPVLYPPHACLTTVDRSIDATTTIAVHLPFEDTMITDDELPDSRQVSYVALCRDHSLIEALPNWVHLDDAERAIEAGLLGEPPQDADVLATAPQWQSATGEACMIEMVEGRVPISCEATADGIVWDTTSAPAGNYVVRSQTFAPPDNLWTRRSGVIQIHDGEPLPVATLMAPSKDAVAFQQTGYRVVGCMAGPPGTKVSLQWASTAAPLADDASWTELAELDACEGEIDVMFELPESTIYLGLLLRAVATAPDGRSWTGYAPAFFTVYPGEGEPDAPDQPVPPDHCEAGDDGEGAPLTATCEADGTSGGASSGSSDGGDAAGDGASGCGCRADATPRSPVSLAAWLAVIAVVRRWPRRGQSCKSVPAVDGRAPVCRGNEPQRDRQGATA